MKLVIDISKDIYLLAKKMVKTSKKHNAITRAIATGTPLKTCGTCGFNYGIMTNTEFNPNDIVCAYWESDGLESNDYCSRWKDKESEE